MTEKEKTAFHEAGHCYRAFFASALAFKGACIHQEGEVWWGETRFRTSWVTPIVLAEVAVAGFLAEAKAVALVDGPSDVNWNAALRDHILELIEVELPKPEDQQEEHVWPLNVPLAGGGAQVANFTRSDMQEIPLALRNQAGIEAALTAMVEFLNNPLHWTAIKDIAGELNTFGPKCLSGFRIFVLIRDATADMLEEGED